ncbi:MAG TPA: ABC transporter permease subunit [Phycisphaerales bacterium]|nr:ABC transporter permease subunit [Phycisphaerales bacterium]
MTIRERFAAANRLQRSRPFKIIASVVIVLAAVAAFATYTVRQTAPAAPTTAAQPELPEPAAGEELTEAEQTIRSAIESSRKAFREVMRGRTDWRSFGFGAAVVAALALTVVWLGLGLTYLSLLLVAGLVGVPLLQFEPTATAGKMFLGIVALTASFTALLQLVRLALGHSDPVCSIARVVLDEAVRMKISLVFIVILIIGLAALPNALDPDQPLRYRVQSFLSFSTGLSFWTIAVLVLLFSAATVAFDQRDKIIWQTMTKPVSPWSYILGKWLGVSALSAVLLAVCASGIFLFVEYLRGQPALGEREAYVAAGGGEDLTEDRWILETQVLASRVMIENEPPFTRATPEFQSGAEQFIQSRQALDPGFAADAGERAKITEELFKNALTEYRSIEPGRSELFVFRGLEPARERDALLTFRHRIDAGGNRPDEFYVVSFEFTNGTQLIQRMGPGFYHSATLWPSVVQNVTESDLAAEKEPERRREMAELDGAVVVRVTNGDIRSRTVNGETITFPPGGMELSYSVGSYRGNFLRAMLVLWGKLVFLAIVAVWASTFLSFPVASLVAFGVFLAAEGSGYLRTSLESFATSDTQGNIKILSLIAAWVTQVVSGAFSLYGDLRPTRRLVQGELIPVADLLAGFVFLLAGSAVLYLGAAITLRRRELATYSGR